MVSQPRNMLATRDLQARDAAHYLHPFTDFKALGRKGSKIITRADGIYLWDSDGNRILDGMAGLLEVTAVLHELRLGRPSAPIRHRRASRRGSSFSLKRRAS